MTACSWTTRSPRSTTNCTAAAALGDDRTREIAARSPTAAEPAVRLAILAALSAAADEITAALLDYPGSPAVVGPARRRRDRRRGARHRTEADADRRARRDDGDASARISLRLSEALKSRHRRRRRARRRLGEHLAGARRDRRAAPRAVRRVGFGAGFAVRHRLRWSRRRPRRRGRGGASAASASPAGSTADDLAQPAGRAVSIPRHVTTNAQESDVHHDLPAARADQPGRPHRPRLAHRPLRGRPDRGRRRPASRATARTSSPERISVEMDGPTLSVMRPAAGRAVRPVR